MRELEFLPDWYPRARRRRGATVLHAWATGGLIVALGLWMLADVGRVRSAETRLASLGGALDRTRGELEELRHLRDLQSRLQEQEKVLEALGLPVDLAALLAEVERCAPPQMSVVDFAADTEVRARPVEVGGRAMAFVRGKSAEPPATERWLRVRLVAAAPTDLDVANFFAAVNAVPIFRHAHLRRSDPKEYAGRLVREFEVDFALELTP